MKALLMRRFLKALCLCVSFIYILVIRSAEEQIIYSSPISDPRAFRDSRRVHSIIQDIDASIINGSSADQSLLTPQLDRMIPTSVEKTQKAFLLVGAIRTLHSTHKAILGNLIEPLCPRESCTVHLFTHLSHSDNRPDVNMDDPRGQVVLTDEPTVKYFWHDKSLPQDYIHIHKVPAYDIGSVEEQNAFDILVNEASSDAKAKLMMIRYGDPRRFSMWAARAWAWRHVEAFENTNTTLNFDFYTFLRPDLLWYLPVPSASFFTEQQATVLSPTDDIIWFHDTYFAMLPDTFMLTHSGSAANKYFSLSHLVPAFCLGGPNFDPAIAKRMLETKNISTRARDWCPNGGVGRGGRGFSEVILSYKMRFAQVKHKLLPFGVTLLRPPHTLLCQPLHRRLFKQAFAFSFVPPMACEILSKKLQGMDHTNGDAVSELVLSKSSSWRPYRWRRRTDNDSCLELGENKNLDEALCNEPYTVNQLFAGDEADYDGGYYGYAGGRLNSHPVDLNLKSMKELSLTVDDWIKEPCDDLYTDTLMAPCESTIPGGCNDID